MKYSCEYCGLKTTLYYNFRNHLITKKHTRISGKKTDIKQLDINRTLMKKTIN